MIGVIPLHTVPATCHTFDSSIANAVCQALRGSLALGMDPLSITGTILAISSLAASTNRAFRELRALCKSLPGRLHALNNEVSDLELVIHEVELVVTKKAHNAAFQNQTLRIQHLLDEAGSKLQEIRTIVLKLTEIGQSSRSPIFQAHAWRKNQPRLQGLQDGINTIKCSLNIMLGAANSQDMTRVRLQLDSISTMNDDSFKAQLAMHQGLEASFGRQHDELTSSMNAAYEHIEQRIGKVEELLMEQSRRFETSQLRVLGTAYGEPSSYIKKPSKIVRRETQHLNEAKPADIGIRLSHYRHCRPGCTCNCHKETRSSSPALVDRVFGHMFVGYTGLPFLKSKCDTSSCEMSQPAQVNLEYWFPLGFFWSKILRVQMTYQNHLGPQFELSTLRRVPDSAQCVSFALNGNVEGLKELFKRGLASPCDVSSTRGYSILRWAMYGKQYQTCKFLLQAGADPEYRPIAASDNNPRNKAHQFLLMGGLTDEDADALRCLTKGDEGFIEEQNYTRLHKVILGLSLADLEEEICEHPEMIDVPDAMGRTPLAWASCRGDERAIVSLLSRGAEVNTIDIQHSGVVGHAADRNYATCVRLLLEAGADPNIAAAYNYQVGNPLNVAARNAEDPLVLKTLLDFGADIESSGVDGMTALIHASRRDNASFATLLLEYGANINAMSAAGQTPLTTAIANNSHNVLRLLLDRWFEYSHCPRLTGPHLLQIVALYADLLTIDILIRTNHFQLKYDSKYALGDFAARLDERADVTEKLKLSFQELLGIINQGPAVPSPHGSENFMESGMSKSEETDSEDEIFEAALENIHLDEKEASMSMERPAICRYKSRTF